ncbi:UNVERIFIED_CONTAM: hypothetical protein Slati_2998400 [Sesamum latifolium]|uniref:Uncharacterized protein n=1 Tax=Sesamum latifolium TaxID=2727402 RepID=A0AAW2VIR0_9LAMI
MIGDTGNFSSKLDEVLSSTSRLVEAPPLASLVEAMGASTGLLVEAGASTMLLVRASASTDEVSVPLGWTGVVCLDSLIGGFLLAPLLFFERVRRVVPLYPLLLSQTLLFWTGMMIASLWRSLRLFVTFLIAPLTL